MAVTYQTGGQLRFSVLGKNLTTGNVDLYQINILTGEALSFSDDPIFSGAYEYSTIFGKNGTIIGQTPGNQVEPEAQFDISFYDDYDYLKRDYVYKNSKNVLINLVKGESFKYNGDVIVPIGTNGTDKKTGSIAKAVEMNLPYKAMFANEGEFVKATGAFNEEGKPILIQNPFKSTYNQTHKTFCIEIGATNGQGQTIRVMPIMAKGTLEYAEDMAVNQYTMNADRGCDVTERDEFVTEIYMTEAEDFENRNELYVTAIVDANGTEPASGNEGDRILVIDADGVPVLKVFTGGAFGVDATLTPFIKYGSRFKSLQYIGTATEDANVFAVMGEDGKVVSFNTNPATKRFVLKVMDYDLTTLDFKEYKTIQ